MTLMRRHSCRTEGVEGACVHLLFWLWRSHPALDSPQADGVQDAETNKALEAVRLQRGIEKPPVAVAGTWPSSTPVAGADRTRPVSWLGSISFGAHPRTKGARCFTGGHRRRTPSSPKGLLTSRMQGARRPFGPDVESADQQAVLSGRSGKHLQSSRRRESQERDMPLQKAGTCLGRPAGSGAMA